MGTESNGVSSVGEPFPTAEHMRAIADAAIRAADVIAKSVITDDLMSPVHSEADENWWAVKEVLDKLESLFYVDPQDIAGFIEAKFRSINGSFIRAVPSHWRHDVVVPFRSLWRTVAGLLIYFDRTPLSLVHWGVRNGKGKRQEENAVEHPPIATAEICADGRCRRTDEGLPTVWLGRLRQHAHELCEALPKSNEQPTTGAAADGGGTNKPIADSRANVPNDLEKRVASLESQTKKPPKTPTKTERDRNQRIKFCCPKRIKKLQESWNAIYDAYHKKYPNDKKASPGGLRQSHDRYCPNRPKCLSEKKRS